MMHFIDGPATGVTLALSRTPMLLRVVRSAAGKWDALNLLDDTAAPGEQIFVYILQDKPGMMHLYRSRSAGGSGWFGFGKYQYLPEQPDDATLRSNENWQAWCMANRARLTPAWAKVKHEEAAGSAE